MWPMNSTNQIKTFVVMPCFNEEDNLIESLSSLGFSSKSIQESMDVNLVIIDNNSTDSTFSIASRIKGQFPERIHLIKESEQGYIPARHAGNVYVKDLVEQKGWEIDNILILQADADTLYSKGYVSAMRNTSAFFGLNTMLEAYSEYPTSFKHKFADYIELCCGIDHTLESIFVKSKTYDIIVDDKQCAYRLGDYFRWGTHIREFLANGDEIFAETTRLFLKARLSGATKVMLNNVYAEHSPRRILEHPILQYVTAGFPREMAWKIRWLDKSINIKEFLKLKDSDSIAWDDITNVRIIHLISLFNVLPIYINRILGIKTTTCSNILYDSISDSLPLCNKEVLMVNPGHLILNVLNVVEQNFTSLKRLIYNEIGGETGDENISKRGG